MPGQLNDIFISYSRKNKDFVRKLYDRLQTHFANIWVDWEDIPLAVDWWQEIQEGIESSDAFMFIISPDSVHSEVCGREIAHAVSHNKRLIPVLYQSVDNPEDRAAMNPQISSHNWIMATDDVPFDTAVNQIIDTLRADVPHVRSHTRLLVRAREWVESDRDDSLLLRGRELREAETWLTASMGKDPLPTGLHVEYIAASRAAAVSSQRRLLIGVSAAFVIMLALAVVAVFLYFEANRQADIARTNEHLADSRRLAVQSLDSLDDNHIDIALLLSLEAGHIADTREARSSLMAALQYSPRLLHYLHGAQTDIYSVAASLDGRLVAAGTRDGTLLLWDTSTWQMIGAPFPAHESAIWTLAFSPDGQMLATGAADNLIRLWDVSDPMNPAQAGDSLDELGAPLRTLAFSPDGRWLAAGANAPVAAVWDMSDLSAPPARLEGHADYVTSAAWSPDGQMLATGSQDGKALLWDMSDPSDPQLLPDPLIDDAGIWIMSVAWSPDGQTLAAGRADNSLVVLDMGDPATAAVTKIVLLRHEDWVRAVAFSPDSRTLVSGGADDAVMLWDVEQIRTRRDAARPDILRGHTNAVWGVAYLPDGSALVSGALGGGVLLWDAVRSHGLAQPLAGHTGRVYGVVFGPDGALYSGGDDGLVFRWQSGEQTALGDGRQVLSLALSPDGGTLALGGIDNSVSLWSAADSTLIRELAGHTNSVFGVAWSPDGTKLASASDDGTAIIWDVASGEALHTLVGHEGGLLSVAWSPDGAKIATGSRDETVRLWDAATGDFRYQMPGDIQGAVEDVAFSPDGGLLAAALRSNIAVIWDATNEGIAPVQILRWHTSVLLSVAFSPDGTTLATGSRDRTAILWDVATGQRIGSPLQHGDWVWTVAFSRGGHTLATGAGDSELLLWDVDVNSWRARACAIANRSLLADEWTVYFGTAPYDATCPGT